MTKAMENLLDLAALDTKHLSENAKRLASFSLFDWITVTLAGSDQPLCRIVRDMALAEGGTAMASIAGNNTKIPSRMAALVNGTISHALDYDDTHFGHIGHLSVGNYPAALASGEEMSTSAIAVRDAFLVGAEAACRLGMELGREHYQRGFHQTATAGAFGATIAAGRIYGLTRAQMRNALSLVSTRASGLKSQFGTMGKPYNAGISASNGVEAASLARRGFTSCDDGIEGPQGFVETHANAADRNSPWKDMPPRRFVFEDNKYKLHACCHGTHAMIEALLLAKQQHGLRREDIKAITVRTHPRWLKVCDIKQPRTGLEVKFSYAWLAAMVLTGINSASEKVYADALCSDSKLAQLATFVTVTGDETLSDTAVGLTVETSSGKTLQQPFDLDAAIPHDVLAKGLRAKSEGLLGAGNANKIWQTVENLEHHSARSLGELLRAT